jgi:predicted DNA-binding transcriptional regulator YafY
MAKKSNTPLVFKYKNWEGKTSIRHIIPERVYFGKTEWHPKEQWLLEAMDLDKKEKRTFALKEIIKFLK